VSRILRTRESIDQSFERLLPIRAGPLSRFESRGDFLDVRDVFSDRRLFVANFVEAPVDAVGQSAEWLL
jgi:hypothetical protein